MGIINYKTLVKKNKYQEIPLNRISSISFMEEICNIFKGEAKCTHRAKKI